MNKFNKTIFPASGGKTGGSDRCLSDLGLSVDFTQKRTNLKNSKILVRPSFNKS